MANLLSATNLAKKFGPIEIFDGLNLDVKQGESVSIVGPSGSGKSTLLHILGLMEKPSQGDVFLEGEKTSHLPENKRAQLRLGTIGFLFQFHYLLPDFNVLENVLIPSRLAQDDLAQSEKTARDLLDRLGLSHRLTHRPFELSGGEQQRAAFARAIIRRPKLLLCDEPTGNLDPHTAEEVMTLLWSEIKSHQLATLIVTHNNELASQTNTSYRLAQGQLEERKKEAGLS